jgi:hypothetical protein
MNIGIFMNYFISMSYIIKYKFHYFQQLLIIFYEFIYIILYEIINNLKRIKSINASRVY